MGRAKLAQLAAFQTRPGSCNSGRVGVPDFVRSALGIIGVCRLPSRPSRTYCSLAYLADVICLEEESELSKFETLFSQTEMVEFISESSPSMRLPLTWSGTNLIRTMPRHTQFSMRSSCLGLTISHLAQARSQLLL